MSREKEKKEEKDVSFDGEVIGFHLVKDKEETIICDVCGHVNKKDTAICKMCSNYLM